MQRFLSRFFRKNSSTLEKFHLQISRTELYPVDSKYVDQLLHEIATKPIVHVGECFLLLNSLFFFWQNSFRVCIALTLTFEGFNDFSKKKENKRLRSLLYVNIDS